MLMKSSAVLQDPGPVAHARMIYVFSFPKESAGVHACEIVEDVRTCLTPDFHLEVLTIDAGDIRIGEETSELGSFARFGYTATKSSFTTSI